ncbi:tRNA (adenosine(37)-N6)-threonylcarbamoyltransferase complex ATPase subunit type 1 TsaE [Lutibaculum baratangense]|uniref:tRNA threonylcarbamoyladenosine biosynthesis protein TsaE n=1 Tax=Lutibaculum baratangense AMV1 TaxID=631454 RepID=V4TJ98_9HYPH|nr:tRNA (adenosine(37)-N6)-threonylcarbamoyltransferase complex ATPase subunit type 1 TsaE [Lutibaculum baratangense]ESR25998.1 ATPase YjeE, predicted to have essential role in cell wall biosynthesis [Lutibaculum baratangense AMV1]
MTTEPPARRALRLAGEAATIRLAEAIACVALPGDLILLKGDLGSGKSTFARAFLRALARDDALEVPSPTFTLLQTYPLDPPAAHLDLYRISDPHELDELAIDEHRDGVVLVEWPERAEGMFGDDRLEISLAIPDGDAAARSVRIEPVGESWRRRFDRLDAIDRLLAREKLGDARRRPLAGDASTRRYERLSAGGRSLVLMDAPAQPDPGLPGAVPYSRQVHLAEDVGAFAAIAGALTTRGFSAPEIVAHDLEAGILVVEDLGNEGIVDEARRPMADRYLAAGELLAELHAHDWPHRLEGTASHTLHDFDLDAMVAETRLLTQWFAPAALGHDMEDDATAAFEAAWREVLAPYADGRRETSLLLRDYHSPNLIWLPERAGTRRIGLIDFQDAMIGPSAYDLASLAMDARVDVSPDLFEEILRAYLAARAELGRPVAEETLRQDVMVMAAQRTTKVLGIFVRLARRDGEPRYLSHLPRLEAYLGRALAEPLLRPVKEWYEEHLPASVRRSAGTTRPA